jgi:hypothetical protein
MDLRQSALLGKVDRRPSLAEWKDCWPELGEFVGRRFFRTPPRSTRRKIILDAQK